MDRRAVLSLTIALLVGAGFTARAIAVPTASQSPTKPHIAAAKPNETDTELDRMTATFGTDLNADLYRAHTGKGHAYGKGKGHKQRGWKRGFTQDPLEPVRPPEPGEPIQIGALPETGGSNEAGGSNETGGSIETGGSLEAGEFLGPQGLLETPGRPNGVSYSPMRTGEITEPHSAALMFLGAVGMIAFARRKFR